METNELLLQLKTELQELKKTLSAAAVQKPVTDKWVSRREVMEFLNYAPTQMAILEKTGVLVIAKVGKRKFILRESVEKLISKNILP